MTPILEDVHALRTVITKSDKQMSAAPPPTHTHTQTHSDSSSQPFNKWDSKWKLSPAPGGSGPVNGWADGGLGSHISQPVMDTYPIVDVGQQLLSV